MGNISGKRRVLKIFLLQLRKLTSFVLVDDVAGPSRSFPDEIFFHKSKQRYSDLTSEDDSNDKARESGRSEDISTHKIFLGKPLS